MLTISFRPDPGTERTYTRNDFKLVLCASIGVQRCVSDATTRTPPLSGTVLVEGLAVQAVTIQ